MLRSIEQALSLNKRVCLAISGGVDSMVLLHLVWKAVLTKSKDNCVHVLHVNHGLRGDESDADEMLVRKVSAEYDFPFHSIKLDWSNQKPSQLACKKRREAFFQEWKKEGKVFFAHHLDDQAETIFMRLMRGTGLNGLKGMRAHSGYKVRPLLAFSRKQILQYAQVHSLLWREDSSNSKSYYERNWVRNQIFPLIEQRRPGFAHKLAALAQEVQQRVKDSDILLPSFPWQESTFYRLSDLRRLQEEQLQKKFFLDRFHTQALFRLLEKGTGKLTLPKAHLYLSCGVLAVNFKEEVLRIEQGIAVSCLGEWKKTSDLSANQLIMGGDTVKKRFQEKRIPVFFRAAIPVLKGENGPAILFAEGRASGWEFSPSSLGQWLLQTIA